MGKKQKYIGNRPRQPDPSLLGMHFHSLQSLLPDLEERGDPPVIHKLQSIG